ncbi:hypothetical protein CEY09_05445 [Achromobacter marplatensis]|uniref:AlpA family transcriptional regulator n=1 Tax=Achromobacter marplatensis TaxID=470868 RepID=A0ABX9GIE4_9BURK|nr:AlpA family phage regulatory protein [Achromobacter marplatensis]OWT71012.1 hypothetical protein CEY09_05445 [Achromobacter marplatensis]RBP22632.1 AlpA family transcriptional regulator [Achromobacter marplatensis]CAB3648435.1 hypothetical protein LMG26219_02616 [Achromobacter marplatensis]
MQAAILKPGCTAPYNKPVHTTETDAAALPATGYVRLPVAPALCGVAMSNIWAWTAQGRLPKLVKMSPRVCAWSVAEVRAWLAGHLVRQISNMVEH